GFGHCDRRRSDQSQSARNQSLERSWAYTFFSQAGMDGSHFLGTSEQVHEMLPGNHQAGHALGTQRGIYRKSKRQDRIAEIAATLLANNSNSQLMPVRPGHPAALFGEIFCPQRARGSAQDLGSGSATQQSSQQRPRFI